MRRRVRWIGDLKHRARRYHAVPYLVSPQTLCGRATPWIMDTFSVQPRFAVEKRCRTCAKLARRRVR